MIPPFGKYLVIPVGLEPINGRFLVLTLHFMLASTK